MTLREASIEVLLREKRPMRCGEIAEAIRARKLHPLPTAHPTSVVNKAIRRHAKGVSTDGARPMKYFRSLPERHYGLLHPYPQLDRSRNA